MAFFGFDYWYRQAQRGDPWAAAMTWHTLQSSVEDRCLSDDQWQLVLRVIGAINGPTRPNRVMSAVNHALALGRRPGRKPKFLVEEERLQFARSVFDLVGKARGKALDGGIEAVYLALDPANDNRDLRWAREVYREHLPFLLELQQLSHENGSPISDTPIDEIPPGGAPPRCT